MPKYHVTIKDTLEGAEDDYTIAADDEFSAAVLAFSKEYHFDDWHDTDKDSLLTEIGGCHELDDVIAIAGDADMRVYVSLKG
jgi:hypothetical protein